MFMCVSMCVYVQKNIIHIINTTKTKRHLDSEHILEFFHLCPLCLITHYQLFTNILVLM